MKYYEDEKIRLEIDELLRSNMRIECNLGTDSTQSDKEEAIEEQNKIFAKIKELDMEFYRMVVSNDKQI